MDNSVKLLRRIFIAITVVIVLAVLLLMFQFTDVAFRVWDRLQQTNRGFLLFYGIGVTVIALLGIGLIYKIWMLGKKTPAAKAPREPRTLENVQARLDKAREQGLDTDAIARELDAAAADIEPQTLEIAFFGKISTGKSSLIRTLIPNAHVETSIIGGSTASIERYEYSAANHLNLVLLDMPGTHQAQTVANLDEAVMTAARRVHIVCYVLDQDITDSDMQSIEQLEKFGKPLVVVLNKINRYDEREQQLLQERIQSRLPAGAQLVLAASAHPRAVTRISKDGRQISEERFSQGDVHALVHAFANLESRRGELGSAQRQALIELADDTLSMRLAAFRRARGEAQVKAYAKKAVVGGLAAVGPGTDVLIQGYLGMDMIKSLTKLYDVPAQDIDLQALLEAVSGKVKGQMTMILALAGNALKAFPGVGTVAGGLSHAVAYGMIFEGLGMAILNTLESGQNFTTQTVLSNFERQLQHGLEKRTLQLVKTAVLSRGKA